MTTLAVDASSPAIHNSSYLGSTPETWASNSFSPPAGSVIVVTSMATDSYQDDWATAGYPTITDSLASHLTWDTGQVEYTNSATARSVRVAVFWAYCPTAPGSMTVSVTESTPGQYMFGMNVSVKVWTGAKTTNPLGAIVAGISSAATSVSASITPTATGSALLMAAGHVVTGAQTEAAGSGCYLADSASGTGNTLAGGQVWYGTSSGPTLTTSLTGETLSLSDATSTAWTYIAYEVLPAGGPPPPPSPTPIMACFP